MVRRFFITTFMCLELAKITFIEVREHYFGRPITGEQLVEYATHRMFTHVGKIYLEEERTDVIGDDSQFTLKTLSGDIYMFQPGNNPECTAWMKVCQFSICNPHATFPKCVPPLRWMCLSLRDRTVSGHHPAPDASCNAGRRTSGI